MPYKYKKVGDKYVVYKKDTGKRVGATAGNKEALRKYLAALHIQTNEGTNVQNTNSDYLYKNTLNMKQQSKQSKLRELLHKEIKKAIREESLQKEGILDTLKNLLKKNKQEAPKSTSAGKKIVGMDFDGYYIDEDGNRVS